MSVTSFPNVLEPATTLKNYAPIGVKFWENQQTALEGLKEFAAGWFARCHESTQAARRPNILLMPQRPPMYSGNIRTGLRERWNCSPRMARLIGNKC